MHLRPAVGRRLRLLVVLTATTMTCATLVGAGTSYASTATSYLSILNHERASRGLGPLHLNTELTTVAHAWAMRMAITGVLAHNPALTTEVPDWQVVGENVGDGGSLAELARAFWASAPHRDNILDPRFTQVGISAVSGDHRIWITVIFRHPLRQSSRSSQAQRVVRVAPRPWPGRLLTLGSTGFDVAYVQRRLDVRVTRVFGSRTLHATRAFQRRHHLAVDGIVGPITWAALSR